MISHSLLYVEDDVQMRAVVSSVLSRPDRTLVSCGSAEEALEASIQLYFDVLVTDEGLPGMSGIDLAAAMLAEDPHRVVVVCSGYDLADALQSMGKNVRCIRKPFDVDALEILIASLLPAGGPPSSASGA
jgi:DNA-binding NtrC family response regulator